MIDNYRYRPLGNFTIMRDFSATSPKTSWVILKMAAFSIRMLQIRLVSTINCCQNAHYCKHENNLNMTVVQLMTRDAYGFLSAHNR